MGLTTCIFLTDELKFDNVYSWTRSKELFYSVKVVSPDTEALDSAVPGPPLDLPSNGSQDSDASIEPDLETGLTNEAEEGAVGGEAVVTESKQMI